MLGNNIDADDDILTATLVSGVSYSMLSLSVDGSFIYVHDGSEASSDSFTYQACDDAEGSA